MSYQPLSNNSVYSSGTGSYSYPVVKKTLPLKVVSSVNEDNGINSTGNNTTFSYSGFKYAYRGKGILGFDQVVRKNVALNTQTYRNYGVNTTYLFPYLTQEQVKQGSATLSLTTNANQVYLYSDGTIFPYVSQTVNNDYVSNTSVNQTFAYTVPPPLIPVGVTYSINIGKPSTITTNKGNGLEITTQSFTYPNYSSPLGTNPIPLYVYSKPSSITTSNVRQGYPAYARKQNYTYSATTGLPTSTITDPGTSNAFTTNYTYDAYGNLTAKSSSASGLATRTDAFTYDPSHRYVAQSWNTAFPNVKTSKTYDPLTGSALTITQPDGLTITNTYDAFLRLATTSDNNGGATEINYFTGLSVSYWPANAKYVITASPNTNGFSYKFYDRLGRLIRQSSAGFDGQDILVDYQYNIKGQMFKTSKPYFEGGTPQYITYTFDSKDRLIQESRPEGNSTIAYTISGSNYIVTATDAAAQQKKTTTDKSGKTIKTEDNGGVLSYTYYSNGEVKEVSLGGTIVSTKKYDDFGRVIEDSDPNYGSYEYTYNPFDELTGKKDPKGNQFYYNYNQGGYLTQDGQVGGAIFNHTYYFGAGPNSGKLVQLSQAGGGPVINYDYGMGDKLNYEERILGAEIFKTQYTYDNYGRVATRTYPNNKQIQYRYHIQDGSLEAITTNTPFSKKIYECDSKNAYNEITKFTQGRPWGSSAPYAATTLQSFDIHGLLNGQTSTSYLGVSLRQLAYDFIPATGNLDSRIDFLRSIKEVFTYDDLNRLTEINPLPATVGGTPPLPPSQEMNYSANGNLLFKTDAGSFSYSPANQVKEIVPYVDIPEATQTLTYTPYNKVLTIKENDQMAAFTYWPDQYRAQMDLADKDAIQKTKYYAPGYEKEVVPSTGMVRELCYITGPDGNIVAISETKDGAENMYYTLTDHLGSITHIIDADGNLVEEKSYDAWGRLRDPGTWGLLPPVTGNLADLTWDRGYTGHEYLPQFGIVNMNGRLYDPVMGRMFSPDPYIIGSGNTQGYNRYTYALNNPLKYTDPNGEHPLLVAMAVGAAISALSYTANVAFSDGGFNNWNWFQFSYATITGGISSAITFGIGSAFGPVGGIANELGRAGAHGLAGYITSHGNISAGLASSVSSFGGYIGQNIPILNTDVGSLAFSAGMGGLTSEISGGNFFQGFLTASAVHLLNQQLHKGQGNRSDKNKKNYYTREELNDHYKGNTGDPLTINLAKVDLKHWTPDDFDNKVGKSKWVQTLWWSKDGTSLGHIKMTYIGNGKVTVQDDEYNFEMHSWLNPGNWVRNFATWGGDPLYGKSFIIHFVGEGTLGTP